MGRGQGRWWGGVRGEVTHFHEGSVNFVRLNYYDRGIIIS